MAIADYSSTAGSNTSIGGINIAENCSPAGINNAIRQLMADLAEWYAAGGAAGGGGQPIDATLTAIAGLVFAADQFMYATGNDAFATASITAFGRSLLAASDASAGASIIGTGATLSGTGGTSWAMALGGGITMTGRTLTISANTTTTFAFGNGHTYGLWANAWMSGNDDVGDVSPGLRSNNLTGASIFNNDDGAVSCQLFSIGI